MYSGTATVTNKTGLHARPASDLVAKAKSYQSKLTIRETSEPDEEGVNAKSIVMLLSRAFDQGTEVTLTGDGPDAEQAVTELIELIESGFGEL